MLTSFAPVHGARRTQPCGISKYSVVGLRSHSPWASEDVVVVVGVVVVVIGLRGRPRIWYGRYFAKRLAPNSVVAAVELRRSGEVSLICADEHDTANVAVGWCRDRAGTALHTSWLD